MKYMHIYLPLQVYKQNQSILPLSVIDVIIFIYIYIYKEYYQVQNTFHLSNEVKLMSIS